MSLFLKIFLWFWLSIALVVGVVSFINWSTQPENISRQLQSFIAEAVNINSETAAQIYENEGQNGLEDYLQRLESSERVNAAGFLDINGKQIAGTKIEEIPENLFDKALLSENAEFIFAPGETFAAKRVELKRGGKFVFITHLKRSQVAAFPDLRTRVLQVLAIILTAGLGCYGLARYLTSPIAKLRRATLKLASGDLKARVLPEIGKRRDELARLAEDFDEMAERIENLLTSQKRLTQDVSHELRSPLARMNVALELAKQKTNVENLSLLQRIERESNNLNEMISRLLLLSKLESGEPDIEKRRINLTKLIEQIAADADFEARGKDKAVKIIENADCQIYGNENLLRSAVENVVRNALRYTNEKTTIEITLKNENGNAFVIVKDYGAGVAENELENLFRPFYRVGEDRTRKTGGIGLGLAIAERAVHAHKGTIRAKNTADGLQVEIKLPNDGN
ncbi:MAG: ATP-binding protein [Acidobacteriota bacterium]|nr:ATP-binding protein [Acidobacteriota bacterium]